MTMVEAFTSSVQTTVLCVAIALVSVAVLWLVVRAVECARRHAAAMLLALIAGICGADKTNLLMRVIVQPQPVARIESSTAMRGGSGECFYFAWDRRGAWQRSEWFPFDNGWVFPCGTNHLNGVEVVSQGAIWPSPFDTNAIAAVATPVSIIPGTTQFWVEHTMSNSYRFVWVDAAVNRDPNQLVSAEFELFRNGDVAVTTNGVLELLPRELPFAHDGFGQDAAWVSANFSNATEILSVGYPEWVDSQVGVGLTNGLYKFTASFYDEPLETVRLVVGDYSVAVTNSGEYVFLLEKGRDYEYGTTPFVSNVTYSAFDDIGPLLRQGAGGDGGGTAEWTIDGGYGNEPQTEESLGRVWWMPLFFGSPGVSHLWPWGDQPVFSAQFSDFRTPPAATYAWTASEGLTVVSPSSPTTAVVAESMPSWAQASLSVSATLGNHTLVSRLDGLTYGTNDTPQVHLALNVPKIVFTGDSIVSNGTRRLMHVGFHADVATNGTVQLNWFSGASRISLWSGIDASAVMLEKGCQWDADSFAGFSCYVSGDERSSDIDDVKVECRFVPQSGDVIAITQSLTVAYMHYSTVSEIPGNRQRTELGVAEELRFSYAPEGILHGASCSFGKLSPPGFGNSLFTAPETGCVSTVSFSAQDMTLEYGFTVVEPSGVLVSHVEETNYTNPGFSGLIDLKYHLYVQPTNVSFYALEFCEVDRPATNVWGYYAQPSMAERIQHHGAGCWGGVGYDNSDTDNVRVGYNPPPWLDGGGYRWPIPLIWRTKNGDGETHVLTNYFQRFELDSDGTARVTKFGFCYERTTNCVFNVYIRSDDE